MKTFLLLPVLILLLSVSVSAGKHYFSIGGGYNIPSAKLTFGINEENNISKGIYSSFGKGIGVNLAYGFDLGKNADLEFGLSYLIGGEISANSSGQSSTSENKASANMFRIMPQLRIRSGSDNPWYIRSGIVIGLASKVKMHSSETDFYQGFSSTSLIETEYTGGASIGFTAAIGKEFAIGKTA